MPKGVGYGNPHGKGGKKKGGKKKPKIRKTGKGGKS